MSARLLWVILVACAALSLLLHLHLPGPAAGLASSEPSFAGEVFHSGPALDRAALVAAREAGNAAAARRGFLWTLAGLFALYAAVLRTVRGQQSHAVTGFLMVCGLLFALAHFFAPVMLSTDVYAYALYGRVLAVYGASPYAAAPPVPATDPFLQLYGLEYLPSWYGPLWTLASAGLARLGGVALGATVLMFKGLVTLCLGASGALVWSILRRLSPGRVSQGVALLMWNPLLLMETGLSAHNDLAMLVLVLLAVRLHLAGSRVGAALALTLSAMVKFVTGLLLPLYLWMVLRQEQSWRARLGLLARAGAVSAAVWFGGEALAGKGGEATVGQQALAPDFYRNGPLELVFTALRRGFGEGAERVRTPIYFQGWWLRAREAQALREGGGAAYPAIRPLAPGERVLVCAPQDSDWARVYDPGSRRRGYIDARLCEEAARPAGLDGDAEVALGEQMPTEWPTVRAANRTVRVAAWTLFAACGFVAARWTRDLATFLVGSAALVLAAQYLVVTETWPWYANWGVALAALAPHRLPARLAVLLSACAPSLYVTMDFQGGAAAWVDTYRAIPAFGLPLLLFSASLAWQAREQMA